MEIEIILDRSRWETLKALGAPDPDHDRLDRRAVKELIESELATLRDGVPVITPMGRKVVVRGSSHLWDLS
jgi:hypothetical protein